MSAGCSGRLRKRSPPAGVQPVPNFPSVTVLGARSSLSAALARDVPSSQWQHMALSEVNGLQGDPAVQQVLLPKQVTAQGFLRAVKIRQPPRSWELGEHHRADRLLCGSSVSFVHHH